MDEIYQIGFIHGLEWALKHPELIKEKINEIEKEL